MFSKIYIFGAGAIGSYYAAMLSRKFDVCLIEKNAKIVRAININGLRLIGKVKGKFPIKAFQRIRKFQDNSLILICTKANANKAIAKMLQKSIGKNNIILVMQNGLNVEEIFRRKLQKKAKIFRAVIWAAASVVGVGKIKVNFKGWITIGKSKSERKIAKIFKGAKIAVKQNKNLRKNMWEKLFVNAAINPLSAIIGKRNGELLKFANIVREIVNECLLVAKREGLNFSRKRTLHMVMRSIKATRNNISSMLQDLSHKRVTEIDFISGAIVNMAKEHKLKAELNYGLWKVIKLLEKTYT